jgi:hypothetical protein
MFRPSAPRTAGATAIAFGTAAFLCLGVPAAAFAAEPAAPPKSPAQAAEIEPGTGTASAGDVPAGTAGGSGTGSTSGAPDEAEAIETAAGGDGTPSGTDVPFETAGPPKSGTGTDPKEAEAIETAPTYPDNGTPTESPVGEAPDDEPQPNWFPVVHDDFYTVLANHSFATAWSTVLGNDVDPDGDAIVPVSIKEPVHGTAEYDGLLPSGNITYTPAPGFTGVETLAYSIKDSKGAKSATTGTITITVVPDHAPVAQLDTFSATSGVQLDVPSPGVLTNDFDADSDLPGATVSLTGLPSHGTLTQPSLAGGFRYTSVAGYVGQDTFSYTIDDGHGRVSAPAQVVITVTNQPFFMTSVPTMTGTAAVGATLTAKTGTWTPGPSFSYQWKRNGASITGATKSAYTLTANDAGTSVAVVVTGYAPGISVTSIASAAVKVALPSFTTAPTPVIAGSTVRGALLTAKTGAWAPAPASFAYQWLRNGVPITGATAKTYTSSAADVTKTIAVKVTAAKPGITSLAKTSSGVVIADPPFAAAPVPTISGTAMLGATLTASPGSWSPAPATVSYQWLRAGVKITGATAKAYKPVAADVGKVVAVKVTATKPGFITTTLVSMATPKVAAGALTLGTPVVTGSAVVGKTLAVTVTAGPAAVALSYSWTRDGVAIAGASKSAYTLTSADGGKKVAVAVTATKAGCTTVTKTSAATAPVAKPFSVTVAPSITGTAKTGKTLTAVKGTWSPAPTTTTVVWKRDGVAIIGATGTTYLLKAADAGHSVTVSVTAVRAGYASKTATSAAVTPAI